jgi:hypothetical protein
LINSYYVRESVRDQENVALAPMMMDLIAQNEMTLKDAFRAYEPEGQQPRLGGRGAYPASMLGASRATRGMEAEDAGSTIGAKRDHGSNEERRELENRKIELMTQWLRVRLQRGEV